MCFVYLFKLYYILHLLFPFIWFHCFAHCCWWDLWLPVLFDRMTFCHSTDIICSPRFVRPESCLSLFQRETLCLGFSEIRWTEPRIGRDSCPRIASCQRRFGTLRIPQLEFERVGSRLVVELLLLELVAAAEAVPKLEEVEEGKRYSRTEKLN